MGAIIRIDPPWAVPRSAGFGESDGNMLAVDPEVAAAPRWASALRLAPLQRGTILAKRLVEHLMAGPRDHPSPIRLFWRFCRPCGGDAATSAQPSCVAERAKQAGSQSAGHAP